MAGKFEISKDKSGKFRFHLKAANGEINALAAHGITADRTSILATGHKVFDDVGQIDTTLPGLGKIAPWATS